MDCACVSWWRLLKHPLEWFDKNKSQHISREWQARLETARERTWLGYRPGSGFWFIIDPAQKVPLIRQYERIANLIQEKYGDKPEFLWLKFPDYEVFRHPDNRKWYALIMNIPPQKLWAKNPDEKRRMPEAVQDMSEIHVLDLKMPKGEILALEETAGIFPAYHMDAMNWISVVLEDTLADQVIMELVDRSYLLTCKKA